jgi:hypothetical protein
LSIRITWDFVQHTHTHTSLLPRTGADLWALGLESEFFITLQEMGLFRIISKVRKKRD